MRQCIVGSMIILLITLAWSPRGLGESLTTPLGELRVVDKNPANWISVTLNIFEHLMEPNPAGQLVPRLATG
jgi:hypothetical protein